jgi:hypothetical protein
VPAPKKKVDTGPSHKQQQIRSAASLFKGVAGLLHAVRTRRSFVPVDLTAEFTKTGSGKT